MRLAILYAMNTDELLEIMYFQKTRILLSAVELGFFPLLSDPHSADEVAGAKNLDPRATERLLNALVAMDILELTDGKYITVPSLRKALDDGPESVIGSIMHRARLWVVWSSLSDVIRTGKTHYELDEPDFDFRSHLPNFIRAMAVGGKRQAEETVARLNLDGVGRVIDIGGGPGIYAAAFAKALPDAEVFVLDQPDVVAIATEFIGDLIATGRVKYISGDALAIDDEKVFGRDGSGKYDIVFMSNLIHAFSPEQVKEVIARSVRWCRPGGRFVCKDYFVDDTRTEPPRAALFAINMLVGTPGGNAYSWTEMEEWLNLPRNSDGEAMVHNLEKMILSDGNTGMIVATIAG